jgi:acetoin utilization deacetylase AcuC-like enzyme
MKVFHNSDYAASPHSSETTRKAQVVKDYIRKMSEPVTIVDPKKVVNKETVESIIDLIHDDYYIKSLRTGRGDRDLAESSGFTWGKETWDFAVAHSHGVVAAINAVVTGDMRSGSLSSGLHHASPDGGAGFCTINGLAVGAAYALTALPEKRKVMILDFDAHCGGGTFSHIENMQNMGIASEGDIVQIDFSVSPFDGYNWYDPHYLDLSGMREGDDEEYLEGIVKALRVADKRYEDGMIVIYNAGVDPVNTVRFHNQKQVISDREALVSEWIDDKPAVFTLAGGYKWGGLTMEDIAALHYENIGQWAQYCEINKKNQEVA